MLIEFKVANFRSIREEQTFSLVANNADKELPGCVIDRDLPGLSKMKFLKGTAIYGANASGKSNVMEAIKSLAQYVKYSASLNLPRDSTFSQPFKLDGQCQSKPTSYEITFVAAGVRYLFGLSLTTRRVVEEYLVAYPKGVPQRWYHRTYVDETSGYRWEKASTAFKHDKSLQDKTRDNSLFLSVGPQFNHHQLNEVYDWFSSSLEFMDLGSAKTYDDDEMSKKWLFQNHRGSEIINLLKHAEIGIVNALVKEREMPYALAAKNAFGGISPEQEKMWHGKTLKLLEVNLFHQADGIDPVPMDFNTEESAGTRRFFGLLGPWLDIIEHGKTVFIDEIEASLHPLLVRELLKLLFSSETNPKGAQVIFTTHNPLLMDSALLRRDQVWFTEKSGAGVTHLYPLSDYQPRKDEALAKGYMAGRYGGIPYLPEGLKL